MERVYVKLEENGKCSCFVVETEQSATVIDRDCLRPFLREGVELTCLRREGAKKYGWAEEAEK